MSTVLYEDENHKCYKFDGLVDGGEVSSYEPVDLLFFGPISSLLEKNNPRNISYMSVVIFFKCLDLEPKP